MPSSDALTRTRAMRKFQEMGSVDRYTLLEHLKMARPHVAEGETFRGFILFPLTCS